MGARESKPPLYRIAQVLGWVMLLGVFGLMAATWWTRDPHCIQPSEEWTGAKTFPSPPCMVLDDGPLYEAQVETTEGDMLLVIEPRIARTSVNEFIFLARNGYYDDTVFHRIEATADHAFAQGGDPSGTGRGTPGYTYAGELPSPHTRYVRGTVSMVDFTPPDEPRALVDPPQNGGQFFIVARDWDEISTPNAFPRYTFIGSIFDRESFATLDRIAAAGSPDGVPLLEVRIIRVRIIEVDRYEPSPTPTD